MPFLPSGYVLPPNSTAINGTTILAETHNIPIEDIGQALNNAVRRDGLAPMLAQFDFGGFRARNAANGTAAQDLTTLSQVQALLSEIASVAVGTLTPSTTGVLEPGYIWANGGSHSRTTLSRLWAKVQAGTNLAATQSAKTAGQYGPGNGSSTFTVPNLNEYFVRASDVANIGRVQSDELRSHGHSMQGAGQHAHNTESAINSDGGGGAQYRIDGASGGPWRNSPRGTNTVPNHVHTINNTGGAETRPMNISYPMMIKV